MKISFITTVFNEEKTIEKFLESIVYQTKLPDEIIVVDGGSSDGTIATIQNSKFKIQNCNSKFKIIEKRGNRSVGRNEGIKRATGDIIACSDAGCLLDKKWLEKITAPFSDPKVEAVAGYYSARTESVFQKCLVPYVLVMPDRVDPNNFLPATRSIAFKKNIWEKVNGFDERYSNNEDYIFARKLKKNSVKIFFQKDALVYWLPRKNFKEAFTMFFRFALGDAEAKVLRPKVILIFCRYLFGISSILLLFLLKISFLFHFLFFSILSYIIWSIAKNYRYVNNLGAVIFLPLLQFTSDVAVLIGTTYGLLKSLRQ